MANRYRPSLLFILPGTAACFCTSTLILIVLGTRAFAWSAHGGLVACLVIGIAGMILSWRREQKRSRADRLRVIAARIRTAYPHVPFPTARGFYGYRMMKLPFVGRMQDTENAAQFTGQLRNMHRK
jgi:hypothetical protein